MGEGHSPRHHGHVEVTAAKGTERHFRLADGRGPQNQWGQPVASRGAEEAVPLPQGPTGAQSGCASGSVHTWGSRPQTGTVRRVSVTWGKDGPCRGWGLPASRVAARIRAQGVAVRLTDGMADKG